MLLQNAGHFAKTGGLGDVSYALPKSLKKEGIDVRVILPKYSTMPNYSKRAIKRSCSI